MAKMIWSGFWIGCHSLLFIVVCIVAYRCSPWGAMPDQSLMTLALLVAVMQAHAALLSIKEAFR